MNGRARGRDGHDHEHGTDPDTMTWGHEVAMLSVAPKHWFSWDFAVRDETGRPVAEVKLSSWRERGAIRIAGVEHEVTRHGAVRGAFVLERGGSVLMRAEPPRSFRSGFQIEHEGKPYALKGRSPWKRERALYAGDGLIGTVVPEGLFSSRARVDLPDSLPLVLRLFVVWLTLLLWKRESDAAAASGSAP
jgi:hypothetical protein